MRIFDNRSRAMWRVARLLVILLPLGGCGLSELWFGADKPALPGVRHTLFVARDPLKADTTGRLKVTLPPPVVNADWPQPGGRADHDGEHPAAAATLSTAWTARIGASAGYRAKITAQPVISAGRIFTMDSDAGVAAFDATTGQSLWTLDTAEPDDRSTNIGGGLSVDADMLFAATGRADLLAIDPTSGKVKWRIKLPNAARSAPTIGGGRIYVATIDSQIVALSMKDGTKLWTHQAMIAETALLGVPAPAFADETVVAGFGSGDLVALRAATGSVAWLDSLAVSQGRTSISEFSAITGMPVIKDGQVIAAGLGRQLVSIDLRSGRRLWEREIASTETPWVAGNWLFVLTSDSVVAAISRNEGLAAWTTALPVFGNLEKRTDPIHWTGPVLVGDRLIVASNTGEALALSPYSGEILGKQALSGAISVAPVVAGGTVYLVTDDATLTALR